MRFLIAQSLVLCCLGYLGAQSGIPAWKDIGSSVNYHAMPLSGAHPLQYNHHLNLVSLVHCISPSYQIGTNSGTYPGKNGAVSAVCTANWGKDWDTTLLWYDNDDWGRFAQGAVYNPPGNKSVRCSNFIATGALERNDSFWNGSFFAVKKIDTIGSSVNSNTTSPVSGDLFHYEPTQAGTFGRLDFPTLDFVVTDDGIAHTLGFTTMDVQDSNTAWIGACIISCKFQQDGNVWHADTIVPDIFISNSGYSYVYHFPHMAWNESGTVGYVWFTGIRSPRVGMGDTMSNMGMQPIVYKSSNSGATWQELPRIDFNDNTGKFDIVLRSLDIAQGSSWKIPYFNEKEGIDGTVDRNNRLHLVATVLGTSSTHEDSLMVPHTYANADGETYKNRHLPGHRPYIYDFTETAYGWDVTLIDSMETEAPGTTFGEAGYNYNPWDPAGTSDSTKAETGARIQLSRTPDGKYIVYTWAETDTSITFLNKKWNSNPNVIARLGIISPQTNTLVAQTTAIHPLEINVTSPSSPNSPPYTINNTIKDVSYEYFVAPQMAATAAPGSTGVAFVLPVTVSNNFPLKMVTPIQHKFLSANLNFDLVQAINWPEQINYIDNNSDCSVGLEVQYREDYSIGPNPSNNVVKVRFAAEDMVAVKLFDLQSRLLWDIHSEGLVNSVDIPVGHLFPGIYIVEVKNSSACSRKKIIVKD